MQFNNFSCLLHCAQTRIIKRKTLTINLDAFGHQRHRTSSNYNIFCCYYSISIFDFLWTLKKQNKASSSKSNCLQTKKLVDDSNPSNINLPKLSRNLSIYPHQGISLNWSNYYESWRPNYLHDQQHPVCHIPRQQPYMKDK